MGARAGQLEQFVETLQVSLWENPIVADQVRLAILTFNDSATLSMPLADITEMTTLPSLRAAIRGGTRYAPIFDLLKEVALQDERLLAARGTWVRRPLIIFISDGAPTDNDAIWLSSHKMLMDSVRPMILAIGLPGADPQIISTLANFGSRMFDSLGEASSVLIRWLVSIEHSVMIEDRQRSSLDTIGRALSLPDLDFWL